jgi:hypothetical protein
MNPAAYGSAVCKYHGARRPETIKRSGAHWNYQGAGQTLPERQERHEMAVFFHEAESPMSRLGMLAPGSSRTRGRKPVRQRS